MRSFLLISFFVLLSCGKTEPATSAVASEPIKLKATASGDGSAALSFKTTAAFQDAAPNTTFTDGATLKTSATGQAAFSSSWGKQLALNNNTELSLVGGSIRLTQGEIFLDTSLGKPLRVELPQGSVTTDGAAINIKQLASGAEINVIKGTATVQGAKGNVSLEAAEGATLSPDGTPQRGPSADFTTLTDWTASLQRAIEQPTSLTANEDAPPPPGFGTLSAKTPGTTKERPFMLLSQNVTVTIEGSLARTEVEEVFENPSNVVVEGSFRFSLPEGASVNRYAMYVKDRLMEGDIVTREEGRQILKTLINEYLEEQTRLRDPALVEWTQGNTFFTRIFPILPKEKKRIILAYTQRLDSQNGVARYVYPLAVAGTKDKIGDFHFQATVNGEKRAVLAPLYPVKIAPKEGAMVASFEAKDFLAPADLVLKISDESKPKTSLATSAGKKGEPNYFMLSLNPTFAGDSTRSTDDWVILLDTSQSRTASEMTIEAGLLSALFGSLDYRARVRVFAYDYSTREITDGWQKVSDDLAPSLEKSLAAIEPAGATNLSLALEAAAKAADKKPVRVLCVGDLTPTVGELRAEALADLAKKSFAEGTSISTVGVGGVDELVLEALPKAMRGVSYRVSDGEDLSSAAMRILSSQLRPMLSQVKISIDGVETSDVFSGEVSVLPTGQALDVLGRYKTEGEAKVTLSGILGSAPFSETYQVKFGAPAQSELLPSLWAKEKIDALSATASAADRKEIIKLSKQFGVMSRYTSYIVLESEAMKREFGVGQYAKERPSAEEIQLNAGVVGMIKGTGEGNPFESVFGRDDAVGTDPDNILGGLLGDRPGEAEGGFGLGLRGTGIGGGGTGEGTIGIGDDATPGKGIGGNKEFARGNAGFGGRISGGPEVTEGKADIKGSLDKDIIRRVLRRAMPGIKFCYEQALAQNPDLAGKVKIFFVIAPNGAVSSASPVSGIKAEVDSCVARKISQLSFPAPQGGGIVEVTYPFIFQSSGSGNDSYTPDQSCRIQLTEKKSDEASEKKLAELRILLEKDPLLRGNHQKLVSQLIAMKRYPEALDAAFAWRRLDSSNTKVLKILGELYRLSGKADEAVRVYSGVLDIDPEGNTTVDVLSAYAASKGRTEEAYYLRLGRSLRKANDVTAQLDLAEAALADHRTDEARAILAGWVKVDAKGKASATGKLTSAQRSRATKLYAMVDGATQPEEKKSETPKKAELLIELTWEGDVDLDLWVINPNGKPLFGVETSSGNTHTERLLLPKATLGKYRVQAFDASTKHPTSDISAKILIEGFKGDSGNKESETQITIPANSGLDIGAITLTREDYSPYGWR